MTHLPPSIADQVKAMNPITWGLPVYAGTKQGGYLPPEEAADRLDNLEALERAKNAKAKHAFEEGKRAIKAWLAEHRKQGEAFTVKQIEQGLASDGYTFNYNTLHTWCGRLFDTREIKRNSKRRYYL